jgi:hypothetical protein
MSGGSFPIYRVKLTEAGYGSPGSSRENRDDGDRTVEGRAPQGYESEFGTHEMVSASIMVGIIGSTHMLFSQV